MINSRADYKRYLELDAIAQGYEKSPSAVTQFKRLMRYCEYLLNTPRLYVFTQDNPPFCT